MEKQEAILAQHIEFEATLEGAGKNATLSDTALNQAALEHSADEHELSVRDAIKAYPMAIVWSLVSATCVIMEGYDTNLLSNFFAYRKSEVLVERV